MDSQAQDAQPNVESTEITESAAKLITDLETRRAEALNDFSWWRVAVNELFDAYKAGMRDFRRANLVRANLDGANLVRANLDGANLDGANLVRANLYGANLDGANLVRANLYGANLDGANLDGANLVRANLDGANLDGANLDGANLVRANLVRANLDGANLDGAEGIAFVAPVGAADRTIYGWVNKDGQIMTRLGCSERTWEENMARVREKYSDGEYSKYLPQYEAAMLFIKARLELQLEQEAENPRLKSGDKVRVTHATCEDDEQFVGKTGMVMYTDADNDAHVGFEGANDTVYMERRQLERVIDDEPEDTVCFNPKANNYGLEKDSTVRVIRAGEHNERQGIVTHFYYDEEDGRGLFLATIDVRLSDGIIINLEPGQVTDIPF